MKSRNTTNTSKEDMALAVGAKTLHDGRQFMYEEVQKYHRTFIDPATGLFAEKYLEKRSCPVCGSSNSSFLWNKSGGAYVRCNVCSMCYLNPVFTDEALVRFYTNNNTVQDRIVKNESDFFRRIMGKGLDTIGRLVRVTHVLDIGCSAGFFLDLCRERGWKTSGLELNVTEAKWAMEKGHEVFTVPIEQAGFEHRFEAITLWDVFEHLKDGYRTLKALREHLAPGGIVFMQTPSVDSLATRIMHARCNMFDGLEHVNLYSPGTIAKVAERSGYELLHMETVISEIPIIQNYLEYQDPYFGAAAHDGTILGLIDEKTLHKNLLGYKMQFVIRPS